MGVSFQARHYNPGASATAPKFCPIMGVFPDQGDSFLRGPLCLLWGDLKAAYGDVQPAGMTAGKKAGVL